MPFRGLYPLEFCMFVDMLSSAEPTIHRSPRIYICILDVETATVIIASRLGDGRGRPTTA